MNKRYEEEANRPWKAQKQGSLQCHQGKNVCSAAPFPLSSYFWPPRLSPHCALLTGNSPQNTHPSAPTTHPKSWTNPLLPPPSLCRRNPRHSAGTSPPSETTPPNTLSTPIHRQCCYNGNPKNDSFWERKTTEHWNGGC